MDLFKIVPAGGCRPTTFRPYLFRPFHSPSCPITPDVDNVVRFRRSPCITLTYNAVAGATRLRRAAVHVEIGVTAGTPLPQYTSRRVYDVHEVRVRRV